MDLCLYGRNTGISPTELAPAVGLGADQVERVYAMIDSKRRMTRYLASPPLLIEEI
jgi:NAD+ synthase